ncbi:aldose 1-epimerase [Colwellia chukchiensis]|uniref:Aldose 1-epimerase n=1 Tax=Colwellia chukchiensis TaxID=641665 RepID=A0A1H7NE55_9GAMM|nr:aldose epimerase family protein [Colwellia chukchiensis]SEL21866.1 aldose 1-epimerase [Colwellia chukchiensis]
MYTHTQHNSLNISQRDFGTLQHGISQGQVAQLFTLTNNNGMQLKVSNYGAIIVGLETKDKHGVFGDIVLGFDDVNHYESDECYFGAVIGRFAGRIKQGQLSIGQQTHQLTINHGGHQLHGGFQALSKQLWQANSERSPEALSLILTHTSPHGDNGFPGNVKFTVKYTVFAHNELKVEYFAETDRDTAVNLTQHSYFNLAGHNSGNIYQQQVQLNAAHFLPVDSTIFPTGEIRAVANSAHDFRQLTPLGAHINSDDEQVRIAKGFDNYWLTTANAIAGESFTAQAFDANSGRRLTLYTDQTCLVLYTANYLDGSQVGKGGYGYQKHGAFCFEAQRLANTKLGANLNNTLLRPDTPFYSQSRYVFDTIAT